MPTDAGTIPVYMRFVEIQGLAQQRTTRRTALLLHSDLWLL